MIFKTTPQILNKLLWIVTFLEDIKLNVNSAQIERSSCINLSVKELNTGCDYGFKVTYVNERCSTGAGAGLTHWCPFQLFLLRIFFVYVLTGRKC